MLRYDLEDIVFQFTTEELEELRKLRQGGAGGPVGEPQLSALSLKRFAPQQEKDDPWTYEGDIRYRDAAGKRIIQMQDADGTWKQISIGAPPAAEQPKAAAATGSAPKPQGTFTEQELASQGGRMIAPGIVQAGSFLYQRQADGTYDLRGNAPAQAAPKTMTMADLAFSNAAKNVRAGLGTSQPSQPSMPSLDEMQAYTASSPEAQGLNNGGVGRGKVGMGADNVFRDRRSSVETGLGLPPELAAALGDQTSKQHDIAYLMALQQSMANAPDMVNHDQLFSPYGLATSGMGLQPSGNKQTDLQRVNENMSVQALLMSMFPDKNSASIANTTRDLMNPKLGVRPKYDPPGAESQGPRPEIGRPGFDYSPDELYKLYQEGFIEPVNDAVNVPGAASGATVFAGGPWEQLTSHESYNPGGGGTSDWIKSEKHPDSQTRLLQGHYISQPRRFWDSALRRWVYADEMNYGPGSINRGSSDAYTGPAYSNPYPSVFPNGFADGGSMMLNEPSTLIGDYSGEPKLRLAEPDPMTGMPRPERLDVTPTVAPMQPSAFSMMLEELFASSKKSRRPPLKPVGAGAY